MQIMIDIPEQIYETIQADMFISREQLAVLQMHILKGVELPARHGRLIDADELKKEYPHDTDWDYPVNTNSYVVESIDNSHTIIEADKESEDADI